MTAAPPLIRPSLASPLGPLRGAFDAAGRLVGLAFGSAPDEAPAVAAAPAVVPCHRVIGASGALIGYGGGIERKRWLLEHERRATEVTK